LSINTSTSATTDTATGTGYAQPVRVAALAAGPAFPEQWGVELRNVDFFDVKGDLEAICAPQKLQFERMSHPALHPGRAARVLLAGKEIGFIGEIHPRWQQKYALTTAAVVFEMELDGLLAATLPAYHECSRYPAVVRDISLIVPLHCAVQGLLNAMQAVAPAYVQEIKLFDVYQGKGVEPECKSLAFRVVMQDTQRTLADHEADSAIATVLNAAGEQFGAVLRG